MPTLATVATVAIVPADPCIALVVAVGMAVLGMTPVLVLGWRVPCAPTVPVGMGDALYEWSANLDGTEALEGREGAR